MNDRTPTSPPLGFRPAWLLLGGLALLCALLIGLDTLVVPYILPDLAWGPERAFLVSNRSASSSTPRGNGRSSLEAAVVPAVRRELLKVAEAEGDAQAVERLQNVWKVQPVTPVTVPVQSTRGVRLVSPPRPPELERPASFLVPFGQHRSGLEGAGLYSMSLMALMSLSGGLAFLLPFRIGVMRSALLTGGVTGLGRLAVVGALAYGLLGLLGLFLTVLVVGTPVATLLFFAAGPVTLFGLVAVSLALGRWLARTTHIQPRPPLVELAAGVLALFAASIVPFAGWLAFGIAAALGMGALIVTRLGTGAPWSLRGLE